MAKKRHIVARRGIFAAALVDVAALSMAATAQPVATVANMNSCVSMQDAFARVNNEGQLILLTADRHAGGQNGQIKLRYVYTADANFQRGYEISQQPSGCFEKSDSYTNVRLLNLEGGRIDPRTLIPVNSGTRNSLADAINNIDKNVGERPMLQYSTASTNAGGKAVVTITGKQGADGTYMLANANGVVTHTYNYYNLTYRDAAVRALGLGRR